MKRLKKITLMLIMMITTIIIASIFTVKSYAATEGRYLTIKQIRASGYGYKALEKNIWKICESNSSGTTVNYDHTIYCLKGGPGFGSNIFGSGTPTVKNYTKYFDMKTPDAITGDYANALPGTTTNNYKSLLWLLENVYIAPKSNASTIERNTAAEYRELLLENAGISEGYITDDDIDAVQQLAIWHFTNNDEYKVENSSEAGTFEFWINAVANSDANYNPLSDEKGSGATNGEERAEECQTLYEYLVNTAENMADKYTVTTASQPYELDDTIITKTKSDDNYIIGPFQINKISNTAGTLTGTFKNGDTTITPTIKDANGNIFNTLKDTVGQKFYIVLPVSTTIENITLTISGSYFDTTITYWSVDEAPTDEQPVAEVERTKQTYTDEVTFTPTAEKKFDLALRKFITAVGNNKLVDENGKYIREPKVTITPLINGKTTATYEHDKKAVNVDVGNIVTYTIRVYNEGEIDGYVNEITDYLPKYLEFVNDEFNASYGWKVSSDGRTVTTDITSPDTEYSASRDTLYANRTKNNDKVLLKAFDTENKKLDYIDVQIKCKVKDTGLAEKITNIAEITKQTDIDGNESTDRDSTPDNMTLPADDVLPSYKDYEIERGDKYIQGYEDDDDFEKVIVQKFDLALRKFITGLNDKEVAGRVPSFSINSEGKMTYTHPKTPVEVVNGDTVIYTLRIYNEGNQAGYAEQVKDDIPEGLVYLPDNELNKTYRWKMYKADGTETTNVSEAKIIKTDYLSKAQADQTGRDNLIDAFNKNTMTQPDHKDIKVAFKVTEPNTSDRILINTAEIAEHKDENGNKVNDIDSTPDNDKEDEDDIDIEKVKVKYFDLSLEKIITQYSIQLNGKTTVTKTGHKFGVQPEPVVKIETLKKTRKNAVIKFTYQIKVTNEGEIEEYATEVKDYIPTGLKFVEADNPKWKLSEDGKTVTTDQLKDKLLKPGESAIVEITLQWINGENNLGLKQNWAEISKDKNDSNSPDIDSTPDNYKKGEDDIDDASVILSVVTGKGENYILIGGAVLAILAGGIVLIKKFVI